MIIFPNAKVNIGLQVTGKRNDGYHNIATLMAPVTLTDILEIIPASDGESDVFLESGIISGVPANQNLCIKAVKKMSELAKIPTLKMALHKQIPNGAGLGGGSSDAAFTLLLLNQLFRFGFSGKELAQMALEIGSDCPFFIYNRPLLVSGRGEIHENIEMNHGSFHIMIVKPPFSTDTRSAYQNIVIKKHNVSIREALQQPVNQWKTILYNDFESINDKQHSEIIKIKQKLYDSGAVFSSLSGSGSAVYGLFENQPGHLEWDEDYFVWNGKINLTTN